jgi:predicted Zn finger-like uncharacterized protein
LRIRCERCATIYELDEKRLPPHGALVKCTRCDHVFRAAPPVAGSVPPTLDARPGGSPGPSGDERTALFGFAAAGAEEKTASIGAVAPPEPAPARRREPVAAVTAKGAPGRAGSGWLWVVLAVLVALAAAAGWYLVQSRAATPTTRLPAGVEFLPT